MEAIDKQTAFHGSVEEKLDLAHQLFSAHGKRLLADKEVISLLQQIQEAEKELHHHMMVTMDLGTLCSGCGAKEGGGCCSLFMAGETDSIQMLMNLLAGIEVKRVRDDGSECCFLDTEGCIFPFKPMFCLNYNCGSIRELDRDLNTNLERLSGNLLRRQFQLEQNLLEKLSRISPR